jgi:CheY-like chemotaxis protein
MLTDPKGFHIRALLHESSATLVYRAERERDQRSVVLEILEREASTPAALARYRREYEALQGLHIPGVLRASTLEMTQGTPMLVLEDCGAECLARRAPLRRRRHGAEALDLLAAEPFDAILMDVQMPIMDGYTAAREIRRREHASGRRIPIIAVTASATTEVVSACNASGMDHYLSKPLRLDPVRELLRPIQQRCLTRIKTGPGRRHAPPGQ